MHLTNIVVDRAQAQAHSKHAMKKRSTFFIIQKSNLKLFNFHESNNAAQAQRSAHKKSSKIDTILSIFYKTLTVENKYKKSVESIKEKNIEITSVLSEISPIGKPALRLIGCSLS